MSESVCAILRRQSAFSGESRTATGKGLIDCPAMNRLRILAVMGVATLPAAAAAEFEAGADVSHVAFFESRGKVYRDGGKAEDPFAILKRHGLTCVRLRLFTSSAERAQRDPYNCINNLEYTVPLAVRARKAGLKLMLDLHYSDTWADPAHQTKPDAWKGLPFDRLEERLRAYSRDSIAAFRQADATPDYVQVGNEITPGMVWPDGRVGGADDHPAQWAKLGRLLRAAIRGIREPAGESGPRIVLHLDRGGDWKTTRWFFDRLREQRVEFDIIGQSYYPFWHGSLDDVRVCLSNAVARYGKPVMVVETGFPWREDTSAGRPSQPLAGIPPGRAGQVRFVEELGGIVRNLPGGNGLGVIWWGAEYQPLPDVGLGGFDGRSFFDHDGHALPVIDAMGRLALPRSRTTDSGRAPPAPRTMAELRACISDAVARRVSRVIVPPGIYRGGPRGAERVHLAFNGVSDLDIVADGVTMVCTRRTRAIEFRECRNVTLQGLVVDYDPLTFTQGRVVSAAPDDDWIDVRIDAGYPCEPWSRIDVVDPGTRHRRKGMPFLWGTTARMVGRDVVRVQLKGIGAAAPVGCLASLSAGNEPGGVCHGITLENCRGGMTLRAVTIHCAPGMGVVEAGGEGGTVLDGIRIVPGRRPHGAAAERLLTTSWDGILHTSVRLGPRVENSVIERCGDDSWSVQSADYLALRVEGSAVVLGTRSDSMWLRSGDRLRWSNDSPEWTIRSIEPVTLSGSGVASNVAARMGEAEPWTLWKVNAHAFARVTLDREAAFTVGQSLFSPDRQGNGFAFRGNRLHSPGRVLIKAGGGVIEDNHLIMPHAIVLCPELPAEAAAGIRDVIIRRNTIIESGWFCPAPWSSQAGAISITAAGDGGQLRPPGVFDGVTIEGNTFQGVHGVNLVVSSARDVVVKANRFIEARPTTPPATGAKYGIDPSAILWIAQSDRVRLESNEVIRCDGLAGAAVRVGVGVTDLRGDGEQDAKPAPP